MFNNFLTKIVMLMLRRSTAIKPSIRNKALFHIVRNKARSSIDF
ncbi:ABC transporter [Theileria orientalis strain Shintoku]|uniref:ABC transporter n=1 Tax=Theileria orientalis strain Shintoku TaxID=869250 RepID=J4DNL1_THEOR|nr:ABC transporter [Theileria orientalis strain Shintoku]BAM39149.1 ABC transporter [Theileria orientalis strain Shintoku]|eukprot:XP_009689450.1 ABC transporter [Theileria orientalis strain Shintoku]